MKIHYHFRIKKEVTGYSASCLEFPGCITQGDTRAKLKTNMREALNLYLGNISSMKKSPPRPRTFAKKSSIASVQVDPNIAITLKMRTNASDFKIAKGFKRTFDKQMGPLTFAKFLLASRTSMDLSQKEFESKLGLSRGTASAIENGHRNGTVELAIKVAEKAGLPKRIAIIVCLQDQVRMTKYIVHVV